MPVQTRAPAERGPMPAWIPFRLLFAGLTLGGLLVWITARYSARLPQVPSLGDATLHQTVLSVLALAGAIQVGFRMIYLPLSRRPGAPGIGAGRDTALRLVVMFVSGMLACALVILFMFLTHGRPPSPSDLNPSVAPEPRAPEEPWRAIVEAVPVLIVGGAISVIVAEVITALARAARRLEEATRDLTRRQTEAEVARRVQRALLPAELPRVPGAVLAARSEPAAEVGGDYYDAFTLPDGRLVVVLADVAGKGTPAALVAAALQSAVRTRVAVDDDLSRLLAQANARFVSSSGEGRFATIFVALIETRGPLLRYASAGHNPALLLSDGTSPESLRATGPPLGVDPEARFEQVEMRPPRGSRLLVYSDGLSEAMSGQRELLGVERLAQAAGVARGAEDLVRSVFSAAERWRGRAEQSDDMTAIAVAIDSEDRPAEGGSSPRPGPA